MGDAFSQNIDVENYISQDESNMRIKRGSLQRGTSRKKAGESTIDEPNRSNMSPDSNGNRTSVSNSVNGSVDLSSISQRSALVAQIKPIDLTSHGFKSIEKKILKNNVHNKRELAIGNKSVRNPLGKS